MKMAKKRVQASQIREQVLDAIGEIYRAPHPETKLLLQEALVREKDEIARDMLESILKNHELSLRESIPLCQDTGLLVVFAELGNEVLIEGGNLEEIIGAAAAEAWEKFYLRDSIAWDPLRGTNFEKKETLPFILHLEQVPGDELRLHFALKGGGSENCSVLKMLLPGVGMQGVEEFVIQNVVEAGGRPCPPVFVGVGIGGNFEECAILAKKALLVPAEQQDIELRAMEQRILAGINQRGKGVMGFAGSTTALKVSILTKPCHIASLPVAVNIDCHAHRVTSRKIDVSRET
ncbi:MAG: fumarate hydratase [Candidatus Cloacimonetes bacterium]|nr:fumarate hydratase [Candidatus Cloacimonadota bacterium]